jgi:hypothetical protein
MAWGTVELEPEVRDWLEGLSTVAFATAAFYVDLLAERGSLLGEPYTRQLDGKLREAAVPPGPPVGSDHVLDRLGAKDRAVDGVREVAHAGAS